MLISKCSQVALEPSATSWVQIWYTSLSFCHFAVSHTYYLYFKWVVEEEFTSVTLVKVLLPHLKNTKLSPKWRKSCMDNVTWVKTARPHQENNHKGWFWRRGSIESGKGSIARGMDGCITSTGLWSRMPLFMSSKTSKVKCERNVSRDRFLSLFFWNNECKSRALLEQLVRWSSSWTILSVLCSVCSNSGNRERCHHDHPESKVTSSQCSFRPPQKWSKINYNN